MNNNLIQIIPRRKIGTKTVSDFTEKSAPRSPFLHLFESDRRQFFLAVDGSEIYEIEPEAQNKLNSALEKFDYPTIENFLAENNLKPHRFEDAPLPAPQIRALSLSVAQKCNLGCVYCYAQQGSFGDSVKEMPLETALRSVELLFSQVEAGETVNLSFLGGEPLLNRSLIRTATEKASEIAEEKNVKITFSITTNGTLLTADDGDFFERYGFAVTISLDGAGALHDRLRPFKSGKGSYEQIIANVIPLLEKQRKMQVSARVTVTPENIALPETLDELIKLGFHSVGFSPMLHSPTGNGKMDSTSLSQMLEQMIACGKRFELQTAEKIRYPFLNMVNAMREIHQGTCRPHPCGAVANYLGVSADGDLFACHRFVGDESAKFGNVATAPDTERQKVWINERRVENQSPCQKCWARYLCGGGCHHEVINSGRNACDFIRGWLNYCLEAYVRLSDKCPDYFANG